MSSWLDTIHSLSSSLGVPSKVVDSVIGVESNFNPNAVGDQGTSFGLFQLHIGGQLGALSPTDAKDPVKNAQVALPYIQRGYQQAGAFDDSSAWWFRFAEASGHPGVDATAATNESRLLKSAYDTGKYSSADGSFVSGGTTSSSGSTSITATPVSSTSADGIGKTFQSLGAEILLVVVGLVVVCVAFILLTR